MLFVIRHGERGDCSDLEVKNVEIKFDPHLTKIGQEQANLTGEYV